MAASAIPAVKQRIRSVKLSALKSFTEDVYQLASSTDVRNLFAERVPRLVHGRTRATIKG
jgi:phosphoenolpyruvate-protein kinase (PTS system EI component)